MSSNLQLDPANSTKTDYHNNVDNLTYFEGDLNVTQEMFDVFYKTARSTRAIRRDRKMLGQKEPSTTHSMLQSMLPQEQ